MCYSLIYDCIDISLGFTVFVAVLTSVKRLASYDGADRIEIFSVASCCKALLALQHWPKWPFACFTCIDGTLQCGTSGTLPLYERKRLTTEASRAGDSLTHQLHQPPPDSIFRSDIVYLLIPAILTTCSTSLNAPCQEISFQGLTSC